MKPVHHPYTEWEDWRAGMWRMPTNFDNNVQQAAHILSDPALFRDAARTMLREWPKATEHNLTTNPHCYSWVGQATCCHLAGVPESATRAAWWTLTPDEQVTANAVAAEVIAEWQQHRRDDEELNLFTLDS